MSTKTSKQSLLDTYKALGDNEFTLAEFANGFKSGTITIDDLWLIGAPKSAGQVWASLGAYAYVQFSMPVEVIGDWVAVFTARPADVLSVMRQSADLATLTAELGKIESGVEVEAEARKALKVADGSYQKTRITTINDKVGELREVSMTPAQAQSLLDACQAGITLANEVLHTESVLAN